jgi:hypothetical protein
MQLKLAEAEKLNTANAMYEDVMRRANTVKRATVSTLLGAVGGHRENLTLRFPKCLCTFEPEHVRQVELCSAHAMWRRGFARRY